MRTRKSPVLMLCLLLLLTLVAICVSSPASAAGWRPTRPVSIITWSGAGGMTDLQSRAMARALEDIMGVPFNVANMTGGGGAVAANYVLNLPRDGYTIMGISEGIHGIPVLGGFDKTSDDFVLCMSIGSKAVISVPTTSPINTLEELVAAANAGTLRLAASQAGSIWAIKAAQFEAFTGVTFNKLPYEGSAPSHVAALSGEVEVVVTALSEQAEFIRAGRLRPIALIERDDLELAGFGVVPSMARQYPAILTAPEAMQWVGMGFPADMPQDIADAYVAAFREAVNSQPVKELVGTLEVPIIGLVGEDAKPKLQELNSVFMWTLYDSGLARISPETYGISRP